MASLTSLSAQNYDIGRYALFRQTEWDGDNNLFDSFVHIGTTEGELSIENNPEYSNLTLEVTGPAFIRRLFSGEAPTFTVSLFPNITNMALVSPTGIASAGATRRRAAKTHTLWIVPEELFLAANADGFQTPVALTFSGGAWSKADPVDGARVLTDRENYLLNLSTIIWRADFERLSPVYRNEDGGKSLREVTVNVQQDLTKPEGCQLYLVYGEWQSKFSTLVLETGS